MINKNDLTIPFLAIQIPAFSLLLKRISLVANCLYMHGWAEANAGNLSIKLTSLLTPHRLKLELPPADNWFLVSRTGSRFRDMAIAPESCLMLVSTGAEDCYYPPEALPTSEWQTHKLLHQSDSAGYYPCLLHTHATEIIALCNTPLINDEIKLNHVLCKLLPELSLYLPEGIAIVPFAPPGSTTLAKNSLSAIGDRRIVIWEKHGLLCRSTDIDSALDLLEVVNKAARLYFIS